jgi:hypothetical protein
MVSLSNGLIVLRLMTYTLMPYFYNIAAASKEYFTFREYATIVACFPYLIIFALPIGTRNYDPNT